MRANGENDKTIGNIGKSVIANEGKSAFSIFQACALNHSAISPPGAHGRRPTGVFQSQIPDGGITATAGGKISAGRSWRAGGFRVRTELLAGGDSLPQALKSVPTVMPRDAARIKRAAVEGFGGRITECEPTLAAREAAAAELVRHCGATLVHPYDDP